MADAIAAHLRRSPKAADTVDGIAQWWIREAGVEASRDDVRDALERLIASSVVARTTLADGTEIFHAASVRH